MFAVKVVACRALCEELTMTGREKQGRMFVEHPAYFGTAELLGSDDVNNKGGGDDACMSMSTLRCTIYKFF